MKTLSYIYIFFGALIMSCNCAVQAQEENTRSFLAGFPSVPLLIGVEEIDPENRVLFDTPTGLVAETRLSSADTPEALIQRYRDSLPVLGWQCGAPDGQVTCLQGSAQLTFRAENPGATPGIIILHLEPVASSSSP